MPSDVKTRMILGIGALLIGLALAGPARAFYCPLTTDSVDRLLEMDLDLTAPQRAAAENCRAIGVRLHDEGRHYESLRVLLLARSFLLRVYDAQKGSKPDKGGDWRKPGDHYFDPLTRSPKPSGPLLCTYPAPVEAAPATKP